MPVASVTSPLFDDVKLAEEVIWEWITVKIDTIIASKIQKSRLRQPISGAEGTDYAIGVRNVLSSIRLTRSPQSGGS
jgi:hypothetical protein